MADHRCSSGLGRHLAEAVPSSGRKAIVTTRDAAKVRDLMDAHPDTAVGLSLDVTDQKQITNAVLQCTDHHDVMYDRGDAGGKPDSLGNVGL